MTSKNTIYIRAAPRQTGIALNSPVQKFRCVRLVSTKQRWGNLWFLASSVVATRFLWNAYFYSAKHAWAPNWLLGGPRTGPFFSKNAVPEPTVRHTAIWYRYMLWSYYLVQVWPFWKLLSSPSLFFSKTPIAKKHYKNRGFSPFFGKKNCAQKFWKLLSGPSWRFLRRSQLGPDNNFQLGPDNNFQKCHFFFYFLLRKMC